VRVAIVDTYYAAFVAELYGGRPGLEAEPYEVQHAALMDAFFGTADSYSVHLRALGHEASDLVADCAALQERWAAERGRLRARRALAPALPGVAGRRARRAVLRAITLAQIEELDPDVVYCHNLAFFSRRELDGLRAQGRLVVGQIASPLPANELVQGFDLVVTSFPHFVDRVGSLGVAAAYLPLAVDERVVERVGADPAAERPRDVVFVGGVDPRIHPAGTAMLERLCEAFPVDVWGYGADALPAGSPILERFHGEAWGLDMYRVLASARVAVNRHIDAAEGHANNMRLYEATGMGAALVTDRGSNLAELYAPDAEVATYGDVDELIAKLERLLAHDDERLALARAGQSRTLRDHTFAVRMRALAEILEDALRRRGPRPARSTSRA
jgi:glycosyltransferase involved in cell wall biosynthesis